MTDKHEPTLTPADAETAAQAGDEQQPQSRRDFLIGLGKWSRVVVAGAVFGGAALTQNPAQAATWINRRGGWINGRGGSGGSWINRRGGVGGGSWINRR
jgi:hypothetical protein